MTVLVAGSLTACANEGDPFVAKSYTSDSAGITGIDIRVADRDILLAPSNDAQFHIDYAENPKEFYDISVTDDGVLTMVSRTAKEWTDYVGVSDYAGADRISVRVPDVALCTLSLSTTQEDICVPALTVTDRVSLSNNGGDISFEGIGAADSIAVENKNGAIEGTIAGSWDDYAISCTVKKGESNLPDEKAGGAKTLTVSNNNGDVDIELTGE